MLEEDDNKTKILNGLLYKTRGALIALRERDKVHARLLREKLAAIERRKEYQMYVLDKEKRNVTGMFKEILSYKDYVSENLRERMARQMRERLFQAENQPPGDAQKAMNLFKDTEKQQSFLRHKMPEPKTCVCQYGINIGGEKCRYFPCVTPKRYRNSMGFSKILLQPVTADAAILKHVSEEMLTSNTDPYAQTLIEARRAHEDNKLKVKNSILTVGTKSKEKSLNNLFAQMRKNNQVNRPKDWVTNYGKPLPLKFINKPPHV